MVDGGPCMLSADALTSRLVSVLDTLYDTSRVVDPDSLRQARELYEQVLGNPEAHQIAFVLADARQPPQVQHLGFRVLFSALSSKVAALGFSSTQRAATRVWVLTTMASDRWALVPAYVRRKCAEVVAELARHEWPTKWPELTPALLASCEGPSAGSASLSLSVLCHIAELLEEDSKDLTSDRRRALAAALTELVEQPPTAPLIVVALQSCLRMHGGDFSVVSEALRLCHSWASVVGVEALLRHNLDKIILVGLGIVELRELAVTAFAEWLDNVHSKRSKVVPATHDICRFTGMLVHLSMSCVFDGKQQSFCFHKQVAEMLSDHCVNSASSWSSKLKNAELSQVWQALLFFLRYPSTSIQLDALIGMLYLARAAPDKKSQHLSARPALEQIVGTLFVHHLKDEYSRPELVSVERSSWLLKCLGPVSAQQQPATFQAWREMVAMAWMLEVRDGEKDVEERSHVFGNLKTRAREFLTDICEPCDGGVSAPEGYGALCRIVGQFVARALSADSIDQVSSIAEFEAALALAERVGPAVLRKNSGQEQLLNFVLSPSLLLLKQVTLPASDRDVSTCFLIEQKRMEFISHWSPFYRYFGIDISNEILRRLLTVIENTTGSLPTSDGKKGPPKEEVALQRKALDTLVGLGKHGGLHTSQLEALHEECKRLASRLSPQGRGKLCEALAAAIAATPHNVLPVTRQAQLIQGLVDPFTVHWRALDFTQQTLTGGSAMDLFRLTICGAASESSNFDVGNQPHFEKLRDTRVLLQTFVGVMTRVTPSSICRANSNAAFASPNTAETSMETDDAVATSRGSGNDLTSRIVQAWAPGIFVFAQCLAGLTPAAAASPSGTLASIVSMPCEGEHSKMCGRNPGDHDTHGAEESPLKDLEPLRNMIWELRLYTMKAIKACIETPSFWLTCDGCVCMRSLVEGIPSQRPHIVELMMREIVHPLFGYAASCHGLEVVPAAMRLGVCRSIIPQLLVGLEAILRVCWHLPCKVQHVALPVPSSLEAAFAVSVVSLTKAYALLLQSLAGSGTPQAGCLAPAHVRAEQHIEQQPVAGRAKGKRKDRSKNSFSALADDNMEACVPASGDSEVVPAEPRGAAAVVMRDKELRTVVLTGLGGLLLEITEPESLQRALHGLSIFATQLWNMAARGEAEDCLAAAGCVVKPGRLPEAGELIHAANEAVRPLPNGILRPLARLLTQPSLFPLSGENGSAAASLITVVQQSWRAYSESPLVNEKLRPSKLVVDIAMPVTTVLRILSNLYILQCKKVKLPANQHHLYLNPVLSDALQVIRRLPNTTEADVANLLELFLGSTGNKTVEALRGGVRALLHEASPAFLAAQAAATLV